MDLAISIKIFSSETARDNNLNFILEILGAKAYKLAEAKFWICFLVQNYRTLYVKPFKIFSSKIAIGINFKFILEILGAKAYKLDEAEFWKKNSSNIIGLYNVDVAISIKIISSETTRDINLNFILEVLWAKAYKLAGAEFWIFAFLQSYRAL